MTTRQAIDAHIAAALDGLARLRRDYRQASGDERDRRGAAPRADPATANRHAAPGNRADHDRPLPPLLRRADR